MSRSSKFTRVWMSVLMAAVLMAVATASGMAAASAPTGPERSVAASHCQATLRQELGAVMPSVLSGYQESDCSPTGGQSVGLATLDSPNGHWIGPETVAAAEKASQPVGLATLDNPNGQWIGPETVAAAEKALKAVTYNPPGR